MTSENQTAGNVVKGSNLGLIVGILLIVTVAMLIFKSNFVQDRLGGNSEDVATSNEADDTGSFEFIGEPEITLIDDDQIDETDDVAFATDDSMEETESEEVETVEVITHEPVDTAIGDANPALISMMLISGAGAMAYISKRFERV